MILYAIFRFLCWFSLPAYFKSIKVIGKENRIFSGPLIVVSNHPNTMMDAIHVGYHLKQRIGFLANAGIFNNPLAARIWRYLQVIPVYRQQDLAKGERMDNSESFRECYSFLDKGKTLMILPEGSSWSEMKLRAIRSGTARIALEYQSKYGSDKGLTILPCSLNYSDPTQFRSKLIKIYGEPIDLKPFAEAYEEHPRKAVRQLTQVIRERLSKNMVILDHKGRERMFRYLRDLLPEAEAQENGEAQLRQQQNLAEQIQDFADSEPETYKEVLQKGDRFFKKLRKSGLTDSQFRSGKNSFLGKAIASTLLLLITLPVLLVGTLLNGFHFLIPAFLVPKLTKEVEYHAVMKMIMSWLLGLLWIPTAIILFHSLSGLPGWWTPIFAFGAPITGILAWIWYTGFQRSRNFWNWEFNRKDIGQLKKLRKEWMDSIDDHIKLEAAE